MQTHREEAVVRGDGSLLIDHIPFKAGERVEVILIASPRESAPASKYPWRGKPYRYDNPTDPIGVQDWGSRK